MPDVYSAPNAKLDHKKTIHEVLNRSGEDKKSDLWGAFSVLPGNRFVSEQDDEDVVLLLRAHPITNIGWILLALIMVAVPSVLGLTGVFDLVDYRYVFIGKLTWYLITMGMVIEKFLNWYYSVFIVTNERIVDIDFVNLLHRVVSYANLNHIEEPSMTAGGFIRSIFRYGDVNVATAAKDNKTEALSVPYPERVIRIISELSEELEKRRELGQ